MRANRISLGYRSCNRSGDRNVGERYAMGEDQTITARSTPTGEVLELRVL